MNCFDKFCSVLACVLAAVFMLLGIVGFFAGSSFDFTLPPILGVLPALIGWGIIRATYLAWKPTQKKFLEPDVYFESEMDFGEQTYPPRKPGF